MSQISEFSTDFPRRGTSALVGLEVVGRQAPVRRVGLIVAFFDLFVVTLVCVVANVAYKAFLGDIGEIVPMVGIGLYSATLLVLLMRASGRYSAVALASFSLQVRAIAVCWSIVLLGLLSLFFLLKIGADFSRGGMILFGIGGAVVLIGIRAVTAQRISAGLKLGTLAGRRAILIGARDELAASSAQDVLKEYGATEVGCFVLPVDNAIEDDLHVVDKAIRFSLSRGVELVLLLLPWADDARMRQVCTRLRTLPLPVLLLPDRVVKAVLATPGRQPSRQVAIEIQRAPLTPSELVQKRSFDLIVASLAIVLLAWLMGIVALLIKIDSPGPVIFRQKRRGFNGQEFVIYKFRTMRVMEEGEQVVQAKPNDVRITALGRVLRATSIDELPQLFNVLRGDMSVIGPRPHAIAHDSEYSRMIGNYAFRHHMKPGMTGWAQVHGLRGATDEGLMQRRVDLDLWYINNWSLVLDMQIAARTSIEVLRRRNAY